MEQGYYMLHPNNATLKETAKQMDITLVNEPNGPCIYCVKAKSRMKNMPKLKDHNLKIEFIRSDNSPEHIELQ
jgi:hypothetical protein